MALTSQLISQFAKTVNNANNKKTQNANTTVYGEVVYNGRPYVKIDGSDLLTPVETTSSVKDGDRVTVKIENHTATVTGNLSDPSASTGSVDKVASQISEFEIIIAHRVTAEELEVTNAYIENLRAISAKFDEMQAVTAEIEELQATLANIDHLTAKDIEAITAELETLRSQFGEFGSISAGDLEVVDATIDNLKAYVGNFTYVSTDVLEALKANIKQLDTDKLSAKDADIKYANIDFANINMAAVEELFAKSGIIDDMVVGDQSITGKLVGVTIIGDLIEGGTVKADKLVVLGSDGLYYKLNVSGETVEAEQTEYNSFDGSLITAKSIVATKIAVDDLVAFGATIGGFNITHNSLYSGVKESVHNTTQGVYFDSEGQMALGDANRFLKYYKDESGNYHLDIAASSVIFGSEGKSVDTVISETSDALNKTINEKNELVNNQLISMDKALNDKLSEFYGYIHIDPANASIALGKSDNPITLKIENDMIGFYKNGERFGWWDGDDFYTGNIVVETDQRAQFGNFAFLPRHDGSLSLRKVSDFIRFMIKTQPMDADCALNNYALFSVAAVGEGLKYQWQFAYSPWYIWTDITTAAGFVNSTGAKTANLKFYCDAELLNSMDNPELGPAYKYIRCAVTDSSGETLYTREALLNTSGGSASG